MSSQRLEMFRNATDSKISIAAGVRTRANLKFLPGGDDAWARVEGRSM